MSPSVSGVRRSKAGWAVRGALALIAGGLGYFSVSQSLASSSSKAEVAHRLAPNNARVAAELSRSRFASSGSEAEREQAVRLAQSALRADPTAIPAVTTLGLVAQQRGDAPLARRMFVYAARLSRRDLLTQIWWIEDAVARDRVAEALHHYDIALRTKSSSFDILFPTLSSASTDPAIADALVPVLTKKPIWADAFIAYVATATPDPPATARLLAKLHRAGVSIDDAPAAVLIDLLVNRQRFSDAWNLYTAIRPGAARQRLRDPQFTATLKMPSWFDWVPSSDPGVSVTTQRSEQGGVLEFATPANAGGQLVQQMQLLPAGRYVLEGRSSGIEQPERSRPYWRLICRSDGQELGHLELPKSSVGEGRFMGVLAVPAHCPVQQLLLVARPSDGVEGVSGQINQVQIRSISGTGVLNK